MMNFIQCDLVTIPFCIKINNFNQLVLISRELKLKRKTHKSHKYLGSQRKNVMLQPVKF